MSKLSEEVKQALDGVTVGALRWKRAWVNVAQILALCDENAALEKSLDELHGAKFSDRCYNALKSRVEAAEAAHNELIMAVVRKWPDETRHQTALRYIREVEERSSYGPAASGARRHLGE